MFYIATKLQAEYFGKKLYARVKAHTKTLRVWENAGWHCSVDIQIYGSWGITVSPDYFRQGKFWAMLGPAPGVGDVRFSMGEKVFADPNRAIKEVMDLARERLKAEQAAFSRLEAAIK